MVTLILKLIPKTLKTIHVQVKKVYLLVINVHIKTTMEMFLRGEKTHNY